MAVGGVKSISVRGGDLYEGEGQAGEESNF